MAGRGQIQNCIRLLMQIGLGLLSTGLVHGQSPPEQPVQEVSLCELVSNPQKYDGQHVQVRGQAVHEFEVFQLNISQCQPTPQRGIELQYGDEKTAAGVIQNHRVIQAKPLEKDIAYRLFTDKLEERRMLRPDLTRCEGSECKFYRVTATLTANFFAAGTNSGCCHLLVIENISDVCAERTRVPLGGQFQCSGETWTPPENQAATLTQSAPPCRGELSGCLESRRGRFAAIAKHFGDEVDTNHGTVRLLGSWTSEDLLTTYVVDTSHAKGKSSELVVTRQSCASVADQGPKPLSDPVSCELRRWDWQGDERDAKDLQIAVNQGHDEWRLDLLATSRNAIDEAQKTWKLLPAGTHLVDSCSNPETDQGQSAECGWSSLDGMQTYWVRLEKTKHRKYDRIPWIATEVYGSFCRTEAEPGRGLVHGDAR